MNYYIVNVKIENRNKQILEWKAVDKNDIIINAYYGFQFHYIKDKYYELHVDLKKLEKSKYVDTKNEMMDFLKLIIRKEKLIMLFS